MKQFSHVFGVFLVLMAVSAVSQSPLIAQETTESTAETPAAAIDGANGDAKSSLAEKWDRLIYVPFKELQKVFDNQDASVVLPYAEYLDLMKRAINAVPVTTGNQDALITSSSWTATVEKDLARVNVELKLDVLKEEGWVTLPMTFGPAAIGKVEPNDGSVLLKGTGAGTYELLVKGAGQKSVKLELLATVLTSPEDRSFTIQCPPTGISELVVTIPEPDQTVKITPLQVLLPTEAAAAEGTTVVKASLGATNQFTVHWNPRAGLKPVMDLLSSVTNQTAIRIETGLLQSRTILNYEILRGELRDVTVLVPKDARIIDVVSAAGRIRSWNADAVGESHQIVKVELLVPATEKFQIEIQTERAIESDTLQLIGKSADGKLYGVHADAVVREAGRLTIMTDPSLTSIVKTQIGVKQVDAGAASRGENAAAANTWEFSGTSGQLVVQIKPVEPRLLVTHHAQYVFRDDELRLKSVLKYDVERAGVFQLTLKAPESLTIDSVSADGMSEFNIDKGSGKITLSLTQKRMGAIEVTVQSHQAFDASADNAEMELPTLIPEGVERETGVVTAYAPEFLDVITVDEKLVGLFPSRDVAIEKLPRLRSIASWNFTRRPVALFVRTTPRPAQIAASVGTTVHVEPEIVKQNAVITFDIQNAGIDTLRVAVPEAVANDVRFRILSPGHTIQQRDKAAQAENGWVTWTLVLQEETTGTIQLAVDWDVTVAKDNPASATPVAAAATPEAALAAEAAAKVLPEETLTVEPPRVMVPFTDDQAKRRRVVLTQTRGEIRLLRHESLSITADSQGETTEAIDVRELEFLEQDGYLAYRYFAQPASATIRIRKHEIHEVAATVVSRGAIEIVTERQSLASWRCRFRITTSERQRLRIDLPLGSDLQAPLLNDQRTTIEKATDIKAAEQWEAYYVNISRDSTSDQDFLLTLQFRCPIVKSNGRPYSGRGGLQELHLPVIGESGGSTVIQQLKVVLWAPEEIAFLGDPDLWTQEGAVPASIMNPLKSPSASAAAAAVNDWIDPQHVASGDFPTQGSVSVYRAVGQQSVIQVTWWNRSFLFWMISGTLVVIGLILRRTSWENRITLALLAAFAVALFSLSGDNATPQYVAMAWPGILVVGGIWLTGLLIGQRNGSDESNGNHEPKQPPKSPPPMTTNAASQPLPPGTVIPAPDVTKIMDDLMGGAK